MRGTGRRVATIYLKDMRDAIRDARVLIALLLPLGIGVFYNFAFEDDPTQVDAKVLVSAPEPTDLPASIAAVVGDAVELTFEPSPSEAELRRRLAEDEADLGLIVPAGFDAAVRNGAAPPLTVVEPADTTLGGDFVASAIDPALRQIAGQGPAAAVTVESTTSPDDESTIDAIGLRTWSILAAIVLMIAMIAMLAIPIVLAEEAEKKTLDALVLIASYAEVIAAKALLGITYVAVMVPLLLGITRTAPVQVPLFVAAVALLAIALTGFGLLMAGFFKNANQLNNWSSFLLIPVVAPAFIVGVPAPDPLRIAAEAMPTGAASKLLINSAADDPVFANQFLSIAIIIAWAVLAYGLLAWQLSKRQA